MNVDGLLGPNGLIHGTRGSLGGGYSKWDLDALVGATIVDVGMREDVGEGGFTIDYVPKGGRKTRRLTLGYTELGEWIKYHGAASGSPIKA